MCRPQDNKLSEPAVTLPLATLYRDVTHLLVRVGAGGNKLTVSQSQQIRRVEVNS